MNKLLLSLIIISTITCIYSQEDPQAKPWENQWEANYSEKIEFPLKGKGVVNGEWSYDWNSKQFRVTRDDGYLDRYCGTVYKFDHTPCNHIVREGKRYLTFPEKKFCCMCCTNVGGCGIVKPEWVTYGDYNGKASISGHSALEFIVKGMQNNYYDQDIETGHPLRVFQEPLSDMYFDDNTYTNSIKDSSIFDLPTDQGDCEQSCGALTVCALIK